MRITSKGQITIPSEIREQLGLTPNSEIVLEVEGNTVRIRRAIAKTRPAKPKRKSLKDEPFVGMWRDREDMTDSSEWVRTTRQREWTRR
jgi:AbrB family looped-hinge helix DNA binding protein